MYLHDSRIDYIDDQYILNKRGTTLEKRYPYNAEIFSVYNSASPPSSPLP